MSIVDKVVDFITNDLKVEITEENKKLITEKFYPNIKNIILWSLEIENEATYGGMLTKKHYEKMMTLSPETVIDIGIAFKLKDIVFNDDVDTLKKYCENYHYYSDEDIEYFDLINTDAFASIRNIQ